MEKNPKKEVIDTFKVLLDEMGGDDVYNRIILEVLLEEILLSSKKGQNGTKN